MQRTEHPPQTGEQPTALAALFRVPLHPRAPARSKLSVEIRGHMGWRPPMVAPEARPIKKLSHLQSDPIKGRRGSHTALKSTTEADPCLADLVGEINLI
jgi:hypothetical protein